MLAFACPSCGAPTAISIWDDRLSCAFCRQQAPLPPTALAELQAARNILARLHVGARQLSASQRRALGWARLLQGCLLVGILAFGGLFLAYAVHTAYGALTGEGQLPWAVLAWLLALLVLPVVLFLLPAWLYARVVARRVHALEDACAASPPERPGEPARCHVCGAPLAARATGAVARCSYCQADNVVSLPALARAAATRGKDLQRHDEAVWRSAQDAQGISVAGFIILPWLVVVAPVLSFALWLVSIVAASNWEGPLDRSVRLAWVPTDRGTCVAEIDPTRRAGRRVVFDGQVVTVPEPVDPFDASALVGRRLKYVTTVSGGHTYYGKVLRAYTSPLLPGSVALVFSPDGGESQSQGVSSGFCEP